MRREQQHHIRLRLLQRLSQAIGGRRFHIVRVLNDKDVAPPFERLARRIALERANLLDENGLLIGGLCDDMHIGMISVQNLATGDAGVARLQWRGLRIGTAGAEQRLREAARQQRFADMLRAGEEVGVAYLLRGKRAAQDVYSMFVADYIPARSAGAL